MNMSLVLWVCVLYTVHCTVYRMNRFCKYTRPARANWFVLDGFQLLKLFYLVSTLLYGGKLVRYRFFLFDLYCWVNTSLFRINLISILLLGANLPVLDVQYLVCTLLLQVQTGLFWINPVGTLLQQARKLLLRSRYFLFDLYC